MPTQTAYFALGCFWGPDDYFSKLEGVTETTVGYCGGIKETPTYEDLGDHTETIKIEFDPETITYEQLLSHFWQQHDPTIPHKTQYKSAIFPVDKEQDQIAAQSLEDQQARNDDQIVTEIIPFNKTHFTPAEEYHQKYLQKNRGGFC